MKTNSKQEMIPNKNSSEKTLLIADNYLAFEEAINSEDEQQIVLLWSKLEKNKQVEALEVLSKSFSNKIVPALDVVITSYQWIEKLNFSIPRGLTQIAELYIKELLETQVKIVVNSKNEELFLFLIRAAEKMYLKNFVVEKPKSLFSTIDIKNFRKVAFVALLADLRACELYGSFTHVHKIFQEVKAATQGLLRHVSGVFSTYAMTEEYQHSIYFITKCALKKIRNNNDINFLQEIFNEVKAIKTIFQLVPGIDWEDLVYSIEKKLSSIEVQVAVQNEEDPVPEKWQGDIELKSFR